MVRVPRENGFPRGPSGRVCLKLTSTRGIAPRRLGAHPRAVIPPARWAGFRHISGFPHSRFLVSGTSPVCRIAAGLGQHAYPRVSIHRTWAGTDI